MIFAGLAVVIVASLPLLLAPSYGIAAGDKVITASPISADDEAIQNAQAPLMAGAEKVEQLITSNPAARDRLAGVELGDPGASTVRVYWVGDPTADLLDLAQELAQSGVRLSIVPADFARVDVMVASTELGKINENSQLGIASIAIRNDGGGLTVGARDLPTSSDVLSLKGDTPLVVALREVAADHGVRIATLNQEPQVSVPGGALMARSADSSPYWGGAVETWNGAFAPRGSQCTLLVTQTPGSC